MRPTLGNSPVIFLRTRSAVGSPIVGQASELPVCEAAAWNLLSPARKENSRTICDWQGARAAHSPLAPHRRGTVPGFWAIVPDRGDAALLSRARGLRPYPLLFFHVSWSQMSTLWSAPRRKT